LLRRRRRLLGAALLACALGLPTAARAQERVQGFALDHLDVSERGSEWFAADALDLRGHGRVAVGLIGEWAYRPLVVYDRGAAERVRSIVRNQLVLHPGASVVLWERVRLAADLPVQAYADGSDVILGGALYRAPANTVSLGDLRLGAAVRLFGAYAEAISGALGVHVALPTGAASSYAGDGAVRVSPHFALAGDLSDIAYSAKLGVTLRGADRPFFATYVGHQLYYVLAVGVRMLERKLLIGPELYGHTTLTHDQIGKRRASPVEVLLGLHYGLPFDLRLHAGMGFGVTSGLGSPEHRGLLGLEWVPSVRAPAPPAPLPAPALPPPPPPAAPQPPPPPPDRDGDGVLDAQDACPDQAGEASLNGCPKPPDRDGDGVLDAVDACPDQAGPADADPKRNGCPRAYIEDGAIKLLEQIRFKTDSAEIVPGPESEDVLQAVLQVLQSHPEVSAVRVEGHTDNRGSAGRNLRLSRDRAQAVVKWLVAHGLDAARLSNEGFGLTRPVDSNDTEQGRKNNRRVELHIVATPAAR
jgi:outer membrane protein OmpA-like peptidoglycan-associated protein